MILFLTNEKQSGWNKKIHEARPCAKTKVAFCASEYEYFFARHVQWTCKPNDLKGQRIGNKLANETTTSCQLVQNFLVCAVETSRLHKLKSFGLVGRHSKLYCLCSRDIQNFIVCAVETFKTLLFVQSRHSKLYCLCNRDIQNFIVCAVETFKTLLFVQSRHSKLYCLCNRDIQNFIVCAIATFKTLLFVQSSHSKLFSLRVPSGAPYKALYVRTYQTNLKICWHLSGPQEAHLKSSEICRRSLRSQQQGEGLMSNVWVAGRAHVANGGNFSPAFVGERSRSISKAFADRV